MHNAGRQFSALRHGGVQVSVRQNASAKKRASRSRNASGGGIKEIESFSTVSNLTGCRTIAPATGLVIGQVGIRRPDGLCVERKTFH